MPPILKTALRVSLRSLGLDEKWLQDQVEKDTSILGLGELEVVSREYRQPAGGKLDFLMKQVGGNIYYEVELMLGRLDETHMMRAIEYWDIERQRRPKAEHRAVIVAEEIEARFFNVLRLLNRAVPLIAIKLSTFKIGDEIFLHPVTVLNVIDEIDEDKLAPSERSDRPQWERKSPSTLSALDFIVKQLKDVNIDPKVTYNKHHIAISAGGNNFGWIQARKAGRCYIEIKIGSERDMVNSRLQDFGIDSVGKGEEYLAFGATLPELEQNSDLIREAFKKAESES